MNHLGSYDLRDGRAPNPGSLAVLVNPSDPPKKKGSPMSKKKAKQSAAQRAASMKNLQKARAALKTGRKANQSESPPKEKKEAKKKVVRRSTAKAVTIRPSKTDPRRVEVAARTQNKGKSKRSRNPARGRKRNPEGGAGDVLSRNLSFDSVLKSFGPLLTAVGGWALSGAIQAVLGPNNRAQLAQSLVGQGGNPKDGLSRSKALISLVSLLLAWVGSEKIEALRPYRKEIRVGAGIRLGFDVADMLLPRATDPNAGQYGPGLRSLLGLPDGTDFSFGASAPPPPPQVLPQGTPPVPQTTGFQWFQPIQTRGFQYFRPINVNGWPGQRLERANAPFPPQALLAPPLQVQNSYLRGNSGVIPTENSDYSNFSL